MSLFYYGYSPTTKRTSDTSRAKYNYNDKYTTKIDNEPLFKSNTDEDLLYGDFMSYILNHQSLNLPSYSRTYNTKTDLPALKDVYNRELGNSLAHIAEKNAKKVNTTGWCAREANDALTYAHLVKGDEARAASACDVATRLAHHKNFKKVAVSKEDLQKLPAGCIIVWNKTGDLSRQSGKDGHMAITLGDGREASDNVRSLLVLNSDYSVFVPIGINKTG